MRKKRFLVFIFLVVSVSLFAQLCHAENRCITCLSGEQKCCPYDAAAEIADIANCLNTECAQSIVPYGGAVPLTYDYLLYYYVVSPDGTTVTPLTYEYEMSVIYNQWPNPAIVVNGLDCSGVVCNLHEDNQMPSGEVDLSNFVATQAGQYYFCAVSYISNWLIGWPGNQREESERIQACKDMYTALTTNQQNVLASYMNNGIGAIVPAFVVNPYCQNASKLNRCNFTNEPCKWGGTGEVMTIPETIKVGEWVKCGVEVGECTRGWKQCQPQEISDIEQASGTDWDPGFTRCYTDKVISDGGKQHNPDDDAPDNVGSDYPPFVEMCGDDADNDCSGVIDDYGIMPTEEYDVGASMDPALKTNIINPDSNLPYHSINVLPMAYDENHTNQPDRTFQLLSCPEYQESDPEEARDCTLNLKPGEANGTWIGKDRFSNRAGCCGNALLEYYTKFYWSWEAADFPTGCWASRPIYEDMTVDSGMLIYDETDQDVDDAFWIKSVGTVAGFSSDQTYARRKPGPRVDYDYSHLPVLLVAYSP